MLFSYYTGRNMVNHSIKSGLDTHSHIDISYFILKLIIHVEFRSASHPDPASLTQNMEKLSQILRGVAARPGVTV